ncbi:flagellar basal body-associated FliL family protein [Oceanobacter mangrovi]|uniref:flagellar basal body-associated FliL family protein n=1 Tax=Oceanobacter mangrovi TaxID=2862510 RepID=UPI001C8DB486|nr:flagellar basal body-associated FliL family protein [Oceanobacter mangrovi]
MFRKVAIFLVMFSALAGAARSWGEEGGAAASGVQYIYFEPAFVINFGSEGRMRYLRTEIALLVGSADAAAKVSQHKPSLRNALVFMLSAQEPETVNTSQGREMIRKQALEAVRQTMVRLEGMAYVDDLFFNTFVVQN